MNGIIRIVILGLIAVSVCSSGSVFGQIPKTVLVDKNVDPKDTSIVDIDVLPQVPGKSYSGHLSALFKPLKADQSDTENQFAIYCVVPDLDGKSEWFASNTILYRSSSNEYINEDFSCLQLSFVIWDDGRDAKESGPVKISAVVQYQESSDITELKDTFLNASAPSIPMKP